MTASATLGVLVSAIVAATGMSPGVKSTGTRTISIEEFRFAPIEVTVRLGDTVVWRNRDAFAHTTAADSGSWTSGELQRDHRFQLIPSRTGRFSYHCAAHPVMRGVLIVRQ
jgi:plastocyanin